MRTPFQLTAALALVTTLTLTACGGGNGGSAGPSLLPGAPAQAPIPPAGGTQSAAQRHIFFAERQAAKIDGIPADITLRPIKRVGVIGAGTMGSGIAVAFADAGYVVEVIETSLAAVEAGRKRIAASSKYSRPRR